MCCILSQNCKIINMYSGQHRGSVKKPQKNVVPPRFRVEADMSPAEAEERYYAYVVFLLLYLSLSLTHTRTHIYYFLTDSCSLEQRYGVLHNLSLRLFYLNDVIYYKVI